MANERPAEPRLRLSETQNRIIATSLTALCAATLAVCFIALVWLLLRGLGFFLHIVGPLIVAFFLSLLTRPWYTRLKGWFRGRNLPAMVVFALSILIPLALLGWFFGAFFYEQGVNLTHALPAITEQLRHTLTERFPEAKDLVQTFVPSLKDVLAADGSLSLAKLGDLLGGMAGTGMHMGGVVFSAGSTALLWLMTFFYWAVFMMQEPLTGEGFAARLPFLNEAGRVAVARYYHNFTDIIVSYFRGQFIDVTLQGCLYGAGFQILGLPNGFLIGFVLGLMNLVPYLGATLGLCVALPVAFFHGGFLYTCAIFAVYCCVQCFDGYIMQPYIQGDRMKLSAWQIVFALLFWTQLGGFLGLLLAIPLTAFVKASWGEWRASSERFVGAETPTEKTA